MKKILCLVLALVFIAISVYLLFVDIPRVINCVNLFNDPYIYDRDSVWEYFWDCSFRAIFEIAFIALSIVVLIYCIKSTNAHHAARLTYEEYKERAKQKKLEKTRKKMQELEEKLQKESTE